MTGRVSGVREQTLVVCAFIATAQMTWGVIVPVLPVYLDRFDFALGLLGPIVAAFAVGRVIANVPAGLGLRRFRPRRYLWTVMLLLALVTALTGLVTDPGPLVAARCVAGMLGGAALTIGFAVLISAAPDDRRGSVVATATIVQMTGAAVGALLGGFVVEYAGLRATFVAAAVPALLALVWDAIRPAAAYWAPLAAESPPRVASPGAQAGRWRRSVPGAARLYPAGAGGLMAALCALSFSVFFVRFAGEQGLVPVLAYDTGGLTPVTLGMAMAAGTVVSLAAMPLVGRCVDRGARASALLPSGVLCAVAVMLLPVVRLPVLFALGIVSYSLATSVINVIPGVITAEAIPARLTGAVVGLTRTAGDMGAAIGPLVIFGIAESVGAFTACLLMALALMAAVTWLSASAAGRRPPKPAGAWTHRSAEEALT